MDEEGNPEVPERRNRRPIIVGVAIVAVAALANRRRIRIQGV